MNYKIRNDYVLVRIVDVGQTEKGVAVPEISIHGKEFVVEGFGPDVVGLKKGDKVLMIGKEGVSYYPLPNKRDLIILKEENVVLILGEGER